MQVHPPEKLVKTINDTCDDNDKNKEKKLDRMLTLIKQKPKLYTLCCLSMSKLYKYMFTTNIQKNVQGSFINNSPKLATPKN